MPKPYEAVNGIYGRALAGELTALGEVVDVLARERIRTRQDDGTLRQINLSVPTVRRDVIVAGLRYEKRDGSHTEDHFVFDCAQPTKIDTRYGKKLEELFKDFHERVPLLRDSTPGFSSCRAGSRLDDRAAIHDFSRRTRRCRPRRASARG